MSESSSRDANFTPLSPLSFLRRSADVFPDKIAIVYGRRSYTYEQFAHEVEKLALAIRGRIERGDRVAFLSPNTPEMLFAHFAVPLAGGVLVALNSRLSIPETEYIADHCEARLLFVDAEFMPSAKGARAAAPSLSEIIEIADPEFGVADSLVRIGQVPLSDFIGDRPVDASALDWHVADELGVISINYTSGTTGRPKGVMYSHRGAYLNALGEVIHNGFSADTRYLWTLPMFHCNGWCTAWAVTAVAGTHVCLRAVRGPAVWDGIDNEGVTHLCGSPTVCSLVVEAEEAHVLDRPLRITTAGAAPSPTVLAAMESLGVSVVHVYGLTEVYGPFTINEFQPSWNSLDAADRATRMSRQGVGMIQADSPRIVDEAMRDVSADGKTIGEIVLRGNNVMLGYFRDASATREAFSGGYFHTGDLGVMHADGYIEVKDRLKDIIISGGENISTIEVENALMSHPAVHDVAVVGHPSERWGERPHAYVLLHSGATVAVEELLDHARGGLAGFKVPDGVVFVDELPRTATGKVRKTELRASILGITLAEASE